MFGSIRLIDLGPRDGVVQGECGPYRWEARLTRGPVSYGLDPATLYKGQGRVARLILYEAITGTGLQRKVAAYNRGWQYGRKEYLGVVKRVVTYLEARSQGI
ncbi:MAG: hypothetical protein ACOY94_01310 [Bacillota bacterium]